MRRERTRPDRLPASADAEDRSPQWRAGRIQWDRVGRVALVLVLVAILASYVRPALNFFDAWNDSKAEHASLARS